MDYQAINEQQTEDQKQKQNPVSIKNFEVQRLINNLVKKETQEEAAQTLQQHLSQYPEECDDSLLNQLQNMMYNSQQIQAKFGAIQAINKIIRIGRDTRVVHNVKKIWLCVYFTLKKAESKELVEQAAKCLGVLAQAGGKNTAEIVDDQFLHSVLRDLAREETKDQKMQNSIAKYGAALVLKEFCTRIGQQTFKFLFDHSQDQGNPEMDESIDEPDRKDKNFVLVFNALKDSRDYIRDTAAACIILCIQQISKREYATSKKNEYIKDLFNITFKAIKEKDNPLYVHAGLKILSELIQIKVNTNTSTGEQNVIIQDSFPICQQIFHLIDQQKSILVRRQCVQLIPQLVRQFPGLYNNQKELDDAMNIVFNFMNKKEKDKEDTYQNRGTAFIALGKISLQAKKEYFHSHLKKIFELIDQEVMKPIQVNKDHIVRPNQNMDLLVCIKDLAIKYGEEIENHFSKEPSKQDSYVQMRIKSGSATPGLGHRQMYAFISKLFYFGFKQPLLDTLKQLSEICHRQYRFGIQAKLVNTIHLILTHHVSFFPVMQLLHNSQKKQEELSTSNLKNQKYASKDAMKKVQHLRSQIESNNSQIQSEYQAPQFGTIQQEKASSPKQNRLEELKINQSHVLKSARLETPILDPNEIYDSKYIDRKRAQNLISLFDRENRQFIQDLIIGPHDQKQLKKLSKAQIDKMNEEKVEMTILALKALNTFEFDEIQDVLNPLEFMTDSVMPYLFDENPKIRLEAVEAFTCLQFKEKSMNNLQQVIQVNRLLHKFFMTATIDNDIEIRIAMLAKLNPDFDPFIARYENLLMLFNCMKDSSLDVKVNTIKILGRLTVINPQQINPYFRNLIVSLISQLEQSQAFKEREEAAKLIRTFVRYNHDLAKPYAHSILSCLFKRITEDKKKKITTPFISALLEVMREISNVDADAIKPYISKIFPLILESIKDRSDQSKRLVALKTLISIIENIQFVVTPYFFFPELLTIISQLIQSEHNEEIKKQVFKLIGTLGAVDPYLITQIIAYHKAKYNNEQDDDMHANLPYLLGIEPSMFAIDSSSGNDDLLQSLIIAQSNDGPRSQNQNYIKEQLQIGTNGALLPFPGKISQNGLYGLKSEQGSQVNQTNENKIVLDIHRPIMDEYVEVMFDLQNHMDHWLKKYNIKAVEITKENKFSMIGMDALMKVLNDQTLQDHHHIVTGALQNLVYDIGKDCEQFLPLILPSLLNWIAIEDNLEFAQPILLSSFFDCLISIVNSVPNCIQQYQNMIFDTIEKVINQIQLKSNNCFKNLLHIIQLLKVMNNISKNQPTPQMNFIIPKFLAIVAELRSIIEGSNLNSSNSLSTSYLQESNSSKTISNSSGGLFAGLLGGKGQKNYPHQQNLKKTPFNQIQYESLQMLSELNSQIQEENLHLIFPMLLRLVQRNDQSIQQDQQIQMKIQIVKVIKNIIRCPSFREYIATTVHTLLNVIAIHKEIEQKSEFENLYRSIMQLFKCMAEILKIDFGPFINLIQNQLKFDKKLKDELIKNIESISKENIVDIFHKNLKTTLQNIEYDNQSENTTMYEGLQTFGGFFDDAGKTKIDDLTKLGNLYFPKNENASMENAKQQRKAAINMSQLIHEFDTQKLAIEADWNAWLKKTANQLLKQNPNPVLFQCSRVAEVYNPIAMELYNVAFLTIYKTLDKPQKEYIITNLKRATTHRHRSRPVLQTILNLNEFMYQIYENNMNLFVVESLGEIAEFSNSYAKALFYWEQEYNSNPININTIEKIMTTNYELGLGEAAKGMLEKVKRIGLFENSDKAQFETPKWLEKRREWQQAHAIYSEGLILNENEEDFKQGQLTCLRNLFDWENLSNLVGQMWDKELKNLKNKDKQQKNSKNLLQQIALDGLESSWNLGNWTDFSKYVEGLKGTTDLFEKHFYFAILDIKQEKFHEAQQQIDKAKRILDPQLTSLLGESYTRAYQLIQKMQSLKELEEVILVKNARSEQTTNHYNSIWQKRFQVQPSEDLQAFQRSLNIRSIVIKKTKQVDEYIQFADLARNSGNSQLGQRVLNQLLNELNFTKNKLVKVREEGSQKLNGDIFKVKLSIYDNYYNTDQQGKAIQLLENLINKNDTQDSKLLSLSHLKLSQWSFEFIDQQLKSNSREDNNQIQNLSQNEEQIQKAIPTFQTRSEDFDKSIQLCVKATEFMENNNEAWHWYSQLNYEATRFYALSFAESLRKDQLAKEESKSISENKSQKRGPKILIPEDYGEKIVKMTRLTPQKLTQEQRDLGNKYIVHVMNAIQGLVKQLHLGDQISSSESSKTLQNTLRLMKIWLRHGNYEQIEKIVREGLRKINLRVWINVIPQLIARIEIKEPMIKQLLMELLERLSQKFPQALIYSLSVGKKSRSKDRQQGAETLLSKLSLTQPKLIEDATLVSEELIRAAILLSEQWGEAIDEACRVYFQNNDADTMIANLKDVHDVMRRQPETMNEVNFYQGFASDLEEAYMWTNIYKETKNQADMDQAWDIYLRVFRGISQKYNNVQFYELRNVAPRLLASTNLQVAVPGTFRSGRKIIKIAKFDEMMKVFQSKQHPRRLSMTGDDGREYVFLLKGHEDIRQDERVMQLFGLVNTLLSQDPKTQKKDLSIKRYPVIPLSHLAGLIGMVPNTDTLNMLIRDYRQLSNTLFNCETKTMAEFFENYDQCPLLNKVEIFQYAQSKNLGEDIQRVLWLKSQNSELWLNRRTNYTRSLSTMSMVGYILGLGDRHPSNIMLDRFSGKIIHIDFGDCFESAMRRDKFPEKIPFRLTKMLQKAMEVSGIEGNFRNTCENTMRVLRENKDSLLAILEAFVYDPLLSFRLLNLKTLINQKDGQKDVLAAPEVGTSIIGESALLSREKTAQISFNIMMQIKQNQNHEIRQSMVEAAIGKFAYLGDHNDVAVRTYAARTIEKKNEELDARRLVKDKKEEEEMKKELNQAAEVVIQRINDKLRGLEFPIREIEQKDCVGWARQKRKVEKENNKLQVEKQVDLLIQQATNHENLVQCYPGWCPYW